MSICSMNAHQILAYVNMWGIVIAVIVSSFVSLFLYRITTGFQRESEEYNRGFREGQLQPLDKGLMLGLTDYDAQRIGSVGYVTSEARIHAHTAVHISPLREITVGAESPRGAHSIAVRRSGIRRLLRQVGL